MNAAQIPAMAVSKSVLTILDPIPVSAILDLH